MATQLRLGAVSAATQALGAIRGQLESPLRREGPGGFASRLAVIVAVGVVLRVLYTVLVAPWPPPLPDDQIYFHFMPDLLADGRGFIQPLLAQLGQERPTAAHPPFYSVVLAVPAELSLTGQLAQRLTGTLFGAGTIVIIALLARRLGGDRVALIAAALASVYPILITADGALMSESLYGLFVGISLLLAYGLSDRPTVGRAIPLGLVVGAAALTRGEALLLIFLVLIPVVRRPGGVRAATLACLAMLVVLAPWTLRNWFAFDQFVLISTDAGAVFAGANCPATYYGPNLGGWDINCTTSYPGKNEAEETAQQLRDGLDYTGDHLSRLPAVAMARLARGWSFYQPWQANPGRSSEVQGVGVAMYFVLLPLAVYGLLLLRRRRVRIWLILVPVVMVSVTMVVIYGFLRFRQPAEISLVVLAAVALERLWRPTRRSTSPVRAS
jgi:4-amino-4-deoxy-L-arabinose transferase-like glycosyltransferase